MPEAVLVSVLALMPLLALVLVPALVVVVAMPCLMMLISLLLLFWHSFCVIAMAMLGLALREMLDHVLL